MTKTTAEICHACGNVLVNDRCKRCDANLFTRQRHWRRGDRGGKRPERRWVKRTLQDALGGTWKNERKQITVQIEPENGIYRSLHGRNQESIHSYCLREETEELLYFYKDSLLIEAAICDRGFLVMTTGEKRMTFVYEFDYERYRTCPICYAKSPIYYNLCRDCSWDFEPI